MALIIKLESKDRPRFIETCVKHINDFLNSKVKFSEVQDELFLYETGNKPSNEILSKYVILFLEEVTVHRSIA